MCPGVSLVGLTTRRVRVQEGEEISYFASTCSSVVTAPISGLTGTCDGGAACLCSTGLGECVIIGNATTLSVRVPVCGLWCMWVLDGYGGELVRHERWMHH